MSWNDGDVKGVVEAVVEAVVVVVMLGGSEIELVFEDQVKTVLNSFRRDDGKTQRYSAP